MTRRPTEVVAAIAAIGDGGAGALTK
jgi:hypothetical protein